MLTPDTIEIQNKLASYCRTGEEVEIPGVSQNRLRHYRRLVKNVIHNTMKQAFPITHKLLERAEWEEMVDRFFIEHDAQTPKVWELPKEFYEYVKRSGYANKYDRPYLDDLLYLEWIEIEVHSMPDKNPEDVKRDGNPFHDSVVLNYENRIIRLEYPVHLMAAEKARKQQGNYFVLVLREPGTGYVRFMNLSILHIFLIEQIHTTGKPVSGLIDDVAGKFNINDKVLLRDSLNKFITELHDQKAIIGFK